MNPIRPTLKRALCPENIAVIGASDRTASRGSFVWRAVARSKLLKNAWAINPKYKYIGERPCFSSINEVPGSIDLAVISLRADRILKALIDAGERGVAYALITPDENAYASDATWLTKLQLVADQYGMRLIGPDSLGLMNPGLGVNASYWPNLPRPGNIALITQSGMIGTALLDYAQGAELGFSGVVSTGAAIDVDMPELIDYYANDKNTRVIALHIEGIRRPREFYSSLRAACARKHVVILKAGSGSGYAADRIACFKMGTDAGSEGALAALVERAGATLVPTFEEFTAAVSGFATNRLPRGNRIAALVERAGATLVPTFEEFTAAVSGFATNRLPRGNRIAVIANGSGFASLTASAAQACGIDLHGLSNATIKDLKTAYPSQQIAVNPVNVGATASPERYRKTLQIVLQDPMIDGALVVVAPSPVTTIDPTLKLLAKTAAGSYKPVITAWVSDRIALSVRKQLRSVPNAPISAIQSPVAAALAFGYLAAEARRRADRLSIPPEWSVELNPAKLAEARAIVNGARLEGRHALSPSETGRLLACFEIPVVPLREVGTLEEAGAAADELGWPVALKVTAPGLRHKSDIGGAVLDIKDRDGLAAAWRSMEESIVNNSPMTPMVGAVVQKMVPHSSVRELHLAIAYDNVLGPVVEFGAGGIGSELYQDKKAALVPINLNEADRLVESTRIARALGTYRGLAPADRTLIAQLLCRLSVLAALIPAIRDLTINPLVWTDGGAAAIDADVNLNEAPVESEPGYPHLTVCAPPWEEGREVVFGGEALTLRTFVQSDFHPLKRFLGRLSEKTFYLRFHTSVHLSDERICELASLDYAREAAWALAKDGEIHAVARWRLTGELGEAEFGIVVEDAWQRRGLARVLMAHIETTASERGVTRLVGHVLKGNEAMQGMMTAMGYTLGEGDSRDTDPWVKDISIPTNLL